ncbi:hypothetical protein COU12_02560 [Candidatus Jorgensenbacteria bacterium CG10_big_fil_rev_8_21_14_0_10_54_38]|uniref:HTH luxR-type domain-containing protein n=2 Tax=Candidatus Joergenseniibacteriota TaxID=1752739 RepID=A0A2M6WFJ0_9BACT|nr:MAG: hypothetical protein COX26_01800 [Candidatus Jorgensenbacteria bacterium CG23_combo_of_CG06-09_8_20_14_all_54_14]PIT91552.1 MAG: hypothetical protein COU12_02560 [Candidatus Jorgensenbacteria bacterium CG10_big_fil_rev_8_21_14_0_10_54_38]
MTRVNKKQIEKGLRNEAWQRLWDTVRESGSGETLAKNLEKFFTSSEMTMLEKRLAIPILLARRLSYREICRAIDISQPTVSFVKHHLTRKPRIHRQRHLLTTPSYRGKTTPFRSRAGRDRWNWLNQLGR